MHLTKLSTCSPLREIGGGLRISPQVPMLMLIDTLYVTCLSRNTYQKAEISRNVDSLVLPPKSPSPVFGIPAKKRKSDYLPNTIDCFLLYTAKQARPGERFSGPGLFDFYSSFRNARKGLHSHESLFSGNMTKQCQHLPSCSKMAVMTPG